MRQSIQNSTESLFDKLYRTPCLRSFKYLKKKMFIQKKKEKKKLAVKTEKDVNY